MKYADRFRDWLLRPKMQRKGRRSWDIGPLFVHIGDCRPDRLSWFSIGPAGSREHPVGVSFGGPRRYVAAIWSPAVRRTIERETAQRPVTDNA